MILCITLNPVVDTTMFVGEVTSVYRTEASQVTHMTGGKGTNVARALQTLGADPQLFIALGGLMGQFASELLAQERLPARVGWVSAETRLMVTVVDQSYRQQAFFAPNEPLSSQDISDLRQVFGSFPEDISAVCLCGSSPGAPADGLFQELLTKAAERGVPTFLDSSGAGLSSGLKGSPTVVKANLAEAEGLLGWTIASTPAQLRALGELRKSGARWAILTLGERGAIVASEDAYWAVVPPAVELVNPIGCGDAMTAGILLGLEKDLTPDECVRLGTAAAAANAMTWDACRFTAEDFDRLIPQVEVSPL